MTDSHKDTGYYTRKPSKRERELAVAEREIKKMLEGLDTNTEQGKIEAQKEQGENE